LLNQGDLEGAAATFLQVSEGRGALEGWPIAAFRAARALAQGQLSEASELADLAHRLGAALGDTNDAVQAMQRWTVARMTGDLVAAVEWQQRSTTTAIGRVFPGAAMNALAAGDEAEARSLLATWARLVKPHAPAFMWYWIVHYVSVLALRLDDLTGIEEFVDYAEGFGGELLGDDVLIGGAADATRGRFAAVQRRFDDAITLLEDGHLLHQQLGLRALTVESGIDLGAVLLRSKGLGDRDRDRASEILGETARLAEELGMTPAQAEANALLT